MRLAEAIERLLSKEDVDIAAGLSESAMNDFADAHKRLFPDLYKGQGQSEPLDLKYAFDIKSVPQFNFAPLEGKSEFKRAVLSDPLFHRQKELFRQDLEEPTLRLTIDSTELTFHAISTGQVLARVEVRVEVEAAVIVNTTPPGSYTLLVTSVDIEIQEREIFSETTLRKCELADLIEHILENVLKDRLNRFLNSYPLPQPQDLIDAFDTELRRAEFTEDTLLLGLKVVGGTRRTLEGRQINQDGGLIYDVFDDVPTAELASIEQGAQEGACDVSAITIRRPSTLREIQLNKLESGDLPNGEVFVAFSQKPFQMLADANLNFEEGDEEKKETSWYYYWYRYFYKVWDPAVQIITSGLDVRANLEGGASGGAGLKGCTSWAKVELGAEAHADPFLKVLARFFSKDDNELWVWSYATPFTIKARAWMKPWIPGLNFVLTLLLTVLLNYFSVVILPLLTLFLRIKIMTLPDRLPGFDIPIKPEFREIGNWDGKLFASIDLNIGESGRA